MTERVIIDTSRVEEALRLSAREREIVTDRERTKNTARLIKYSAMGCALVIVSIGVAFWLGMQWHNYRSRSDNILSGLLSTPIAGTKAPDNKIVTNVNLFNSIGREGLGFFNPYFVRLSAGHLYTNSNADTWVRAWCYADFERDFMKFKIDLARRTSGELFTEAVTQRELRELGLTEADVSFLRSRCPWKHR